MNGQIVSETGRTLNRKNTRTRTVNSGASVDYARILKTLIGKCRFAFRGKLRFVAGSSSRSVVAGSSSRSVVVVRPNVGILDNKFSSQKRFAGRRGFREKRRSSRRLVAAAAAAAAHWNL